MNGEPPRELLIPYSAVRSAALGLLLAVWAPSPRATAQDVPFPQPPADANAAVATLPDRTAAIITVNACGREPDLYRFRAEMAAGKFESQGEDLGPILIAKTAWLTQPRFSAQDCKFERLIERPKKPDGSFVHATLEDFQNEHLSGWDRAPAAVSCSQEQTRISISETEIRISAVVTPSCMRQQINDSILAMRKTSGMGTDELTCVASFSFGRPGDWDATVKEVVRLLYMGNPDGRQAPVLDPSTVDHMYRELLSARGELAEATVSQVAGCSNPANEELGTPEDTADRRDWLREAISSLGDALAWLFETLFIRIPALALSNTVGALATPFLVLAGENPMPPHLDIRIPETENHRLMIESSRYLTNADIIRRLRRKNYDHVDDLEEEQAEVRDWLLDALTNIARSDFAEFNSRPYTRYSLLAVSNLNDFAEDPRLRTLSRSVLDLSQAKFAAGANRSRRAPTFRRRAQYDGSIVFNLENPQSFFYNAVQGTDHEVARSLVFAGQTQLYPSGRLPMGGIGSLIYASVSSYQPTFAALQAATQPLRMSQWFLHTGVEGYYRTPAYTVSVGGIPTPPTAEVLGRFDEEDLGIAMPTMVIPTIAGIRTGEVFMFQGVGERGERTGNLCGYYGFACGIQPSLSMLFARCSSGTIAGGVRTTFINSAKCFPGPGTGPHFYLASRIVDCDGRFCDASRQWGLVDITEAPSARADADPAFDAYRSQRGAAFDAVAPNENGVAQYTSASGDRIEFTLAEVRPAIVAINGQAFFLPGTNGDVVRKLEDGVFAIRSPVAGPSVRIDVRDPRNPRRDEP